MDIFPIYFSCERDAELQELSQATLIESCKDISIPSIFEGKGNGAGWEASMYELSKIKEALNTLPAEDSDLIMKVDSDTVFVSGKLFECLTNDGLQGLQSEQPFD